MIKNNKGFSLIELLVSITIILVLTGIGVTSFSNLSKTKKVITVKNELASLIKLSRNLAITRQLPNKSLGLNFVRVAISNGSFVTQGVKDDDSYEPFFTKSISDDLGGEGATISVVLAGKSITTFGFMNGSGRLVNSAGSFITGPITITIKYGTLSDTVVITDLGVINEE